MELEWFWLCCIPGIFRKDMQLLIQYFGSPEQIRAAADSEIMHMPFVREELRRNILYHKKQFMIRETYQDFLDRGIQFVSCENEAYPKRLLEISDYPYGLFVKGSLPKEDERCISIVGARMCTNYGRSIAREIAAALSANQISVVSGLAYGIDGIAQESALLNGGKTYGVLGCGVDICYPEKHRSLYESVISQGAVISEYAPGVQPLARQFPMRNRLISGLSEITIVVEAKLSSGSLLTADLALEQGRDVYALPGRIGDPLSEGCNRLIRQGAGAIISVEDFLEEIQVVMPKARKTKKNKVGLVSYENLVYSCLDSRPKGLEQIANETMLDMNDVIRTIGGLLVCNLAEEISKNYYVKKG